MPTSKTGLTSLMWPKCPGQSRCEHEHVWQRRLWLVVPMRRSFGPWLRNRGHPRDPYAAFTVGTAMGSPRPEWPRHAYACGMPGRPISKGSGSRTSTTDMRSCCAPVPPPRRARGAHRGQRGRRVAVIARIRQPYNLFGTEQAKLHALDAAQRRRRRRKGLLHGGGSGSGGPQAAASLAAGRLSSARAARSLRRSSSGTEAL